MPISQGRRTGEHVHVAGLAVLAFELLFDLGTVVAVEQSRVLGGVDTFGWPPRYSLP